MMWRWGGRDDYGSGRRRFSAFTPGGGGRILLKHAQDDEPDCFAECEGGVGDFHRAAGGGGAGAPGVSGARGGRARSAGGGVSIGEGGEACGDGGGGCGGGGGGRWDD